MCFMSELLAILGNVRISLRYGLIRIVIFVLFSSLGIAGSSKISSGDWPS